jgi:hypothetical protein
VVKWIVPADESVSRPPNGYVVSFVVFHERGFSIPAGRFIRGVLFAHGLQLQHLNPNSIQQMAAFEAMCEGFLGIDAHWYLFQYFFRFTSLRDGTRAATIDCANLRTKQGRGDDYILVSLTSSNNNWHKGWFYLRNGPEHALPAYTGCSIAKSQRNWVLGNSGKPVTLGTLSLTKFLRYVFQEQDIHNFRESGTCEASGSQTCEFRGS